MAESGRGLEAKHLRKKVRGNNGSSIPSLHGRNCRVVEAGSSSGLEAEGRRLLLSPEECI